MAQITNEPNGTIISAYCPVSFNVKTDNLGGIGIQYEVFVNGQSKGVFCTDCRFIQDGEQLVYFSIDVSGVVRDCLGCNFHALVNSSSGFDNPNTYTEVEVEFKDMYEDVDGCVVVNDDTAVMSNKVTVINAKIPKIRLPLQSTQPNSYNFDQPQDQIHTNKKVVNICWGQSEFLTALPLGLGVNGMITAYDDSGNIVFTSSLLYQGLQRTSYDVGPTALGLPSSACSYKIQFFDEENKVTINYRIEKSCCTKVRIHFKNCYGVQDSFNFEKVERINDTTSKLAKKGGYNEWKRIDDVDAFRYNTKGKEVWKLSFCNPTEQELEWLKELQETDDAKIEIEVKETYSSTKKYYCPVRVLDGSQSYYQTDRNSSDFEYSIEIELL